jgi:hypothetical protein
MLTYSMTGGLPIRSSFGRRFVYLPADEHYYGLGQNQEGYLDRRGHVQWRMMANARWVKVFESLCCNELWLWIDVG